MSENEKNETQPPLTIAMVVDTSGNRGNGTSNSTLQWAQELERQGVPWGGHRSRQVTMEDYRHFDRIYYMDRSNARYLERLLPHDPEKIRPLLSRDVADPWYTGDFETTYRDLVEGCKKILEEFP